MKKIFASIALSLLVSLGFVSASSIASAQPNPFGNGSGSAQCDRAQVLITGMDERSGNLNTVFAQAGQWVAIRYDCTSGAAAALYSTTIGVTKTEIAPAMVTRTPPLRTATGGTIVIAHERRQEQVFFRFQVPANAQPGQQFTIEVSLGNGNISRTTIVVGDRFIRGAEFDKFKDDQNQRDAAQDAQARRDAAKASTPFATVVIQGHGGGTFQYGVPAGGSGGAMLLARFAPPTTTTAFAFGAFGTFEGHMIPVRGIAGQPLVFPTVAEHQVRFGALFLADFEFARVFNFRLGGGPSARYSHAQNLDSGQDPGTKVVGGNPAIDEWNGGIAAYLALSGTISNAVELGVAGMPAFDFWRTTQSLGGDKAHLPIMLDAFLTLAVRIDLNSRGTPPSNTDSSSPSYDAQPAPPPPPPPAQATRYQPLSPYAPTRANMAASALDQRQGVAYRF